MDTAVSRETATFRTAVTLLFYPVSEQFHAKLVSIMDRLKLVVISVVEVLFYCIELTYFYVRGMLCAWFVCFYNGC